MGVIHRAGEWFKAHWPRRKVQKPEGDLDFPLAKNRHGDGGNQWIDIGSFTQGGYVDVGILAPTDAQEEFFNRHNPPPRFGIGWIVVVRSFHHGTWVARIENCRCLQNGTWRYEVSDQGLPDPYVGSSPPRRSDVPEELLDYRRAPRASVTMDLGLWGFSSHPHCPVSFVSPIANAKAAAEAFKRGEPTLVHFDEVELLTKDQDNDAPNDESQLEPLHREYLKTIRFLRSRGDYDFAEKMREDVVGLWHEGKVAKGLEIWEALGMTEGEYNHWVERDFKLKGE